MAEHPYLTALYGVFLAYFVILTLLYLTMLVVGAINTRRRAREFDATDLSAIASSSLTVPVSVLVPAHNEEGQVVSTVRSILRSEFSELEVIVIDDGSTDRTLGNLIEAFDLHPTVPVYEEKLATRPVLRVYASRQDPRLTVIEKRNGGKADALNAALNLARYRYVIHTDADGLFAPDAICRMARVLNFDPGRIVGLGASLRVLNGCEVEDGRIRAHGAPSRWIERFQVLEYASVFLADRQGWGSLNAVPVVSGGLGAWRRDTLMELGGYAADITHEDLELTLRAHQELRRADADYRIVYLPDPAVWTEVPHTWRGLLMQRKRWQRTLYEALWKVRRTWFNPRYGTVGVLLTPYLLVYEALGPFVEAAAYLLTISLLVAGVLDPKFLIAFLLIAAGLTTFLRLSSLLMDVAFYERRSPGDLVRLAAAALLEYWVYRPFLLLARIPAFFEFLAGRRSHERADRIAHPRASDPAPSVTAP